MSPATEKVASAPCAGRRRLATSAATHEDAVHARLRRHVRQRDWDRDRVQLSERVDQASGVERRGLDDGAAAAIFRREGGAGPPAVQRLEPLARQPRRHVERGRDVGPQPEVRVDDQAAPPPSAASTRCHQEVCAAKPQPRQVVVQHDLERSRAARPGARPASSPSERRRRAGGEGRPWWVWGRREQLPAHGTRGPEIASSRVRQGRARFQTSLPNPVRNGVRVYCDGRWPRA